MNKWVRTGLVILVCVYFFNYVRTYTEWHFIDAANLIFHEAGHAIFSFFGEFIYIAAGSGFQVALPLCISLYFFYTGQKISAAVCLMWVGQNLLNVSVYAGDAIAMQLQLLGGDGVIHDWHYLLSTLNVLPYTPEIAGTIYAMGIFTLCLGAVFSLYYAWTEPEAFVEKKFI